MGFEASMARRKHADPTTLAPCLPTKHRGGAGGNDAVPKQATACLTSAQVSPSVVMDCKVPVECPGFRTGSGCLVLFEPPTSKLALASAAKFPWCEASRRAECVAEARRRRKTKFVGNGLDAAVGG